MKPVFKCEYCKFIGTEEEVKEHEEGCLDNYTKRSCLTCKYRQTILTPNIHVKCDAGVQVPEGKMIEKCSRYEQKEKKDDKLTEMFSNIFSSGPFGW